MLIPLDQLVNEFNLSITSICHVGMHKAQELPMYNKIGITNDNIFWVEAMQDLVNEMKSKNIPNIYQAVIDEIDDKEITFNITNNGESSSILEFGTHAINHKHVKVVEQVQLKTTRLDTLIERENIPIEKINMLNLDIQGIELRAIKSMEKYLHHINYIYTEVNTEEVYKGCNLLPEMDEYLDNHGFRRVKTHLYTKFGWGDALYIRV